MPTCIHDRRNTNDPYAKPQQQGISQKDKSLSLVTIQEVGSNLSMVSKGAGSTCGTGSSAGCITCNPVPCLRPGKTVKDGLSIWAPASMWETWKTLLTLGFRWTQLWLLRPFEKWTMSWKISFFLCLFSSVSLPVKHKQIFKKLVSQIFNKVCIWCNTLFHVVKIWMVTKSFLALNIWKTLKKSPEKM